MKRAGRLAALLLAALLLSGCGEFFTSALEDADITVPGAEEEPEEAVLVEGALHDVIQTEFYSFSIEDAWTTRYIGTSLPQEGNIYLIANATIKNTHRESIPLYDTDFLADWGKEGENANPLIGQGKFDAEWVLPYEYELEPEEERSGLLIYEVPAGCETYTISHHTLFSDGTEGGTYRVTFEAPLREE